MEIVGGFFVVVRGRGILGGEDFSFSRRCLSKFL